MIISNRGDFIFFHNPKVAGASVHKSLESFHGSRVPGWGIASDGRELAHYGIDEFAGLFPEEWRRIGHWKIYALYRDSYDRFLSSFGQHSRMYGDVDIRFCPPAQARDYLFVVMDRLAGFGQAEDIMGEPIYTAFRPQWVYMKSERHDVDVSAYPMAQLERMYLDIEARVNEPIDRVRINEKERLDLPAPLARLLGKGKLARRIGQMPGADMAKRILKTSFGSRNPQTGLQLTAADQARIRDFVAAFYKRDFEFLERSALMAT